MKTNLVSVGRSPKCKGLEPSVDCGVQGRCVAFADEEHEALWEVLNLTHVLVADIDPRRGPARSLVFGRLDREIAECALHLNKFLTCNVKRALS